MATHRRGQLTVVVVDTTGLSFDDAVLGVLPPRQVPFSPGCIPPVPNISDNGYNASELTLSVNSVVARGGRDDDIPHRRGPLWQRHDRIGLDHDVAPRFYHHGHDDR